MAHVQVLQQMEAHVRRAPAREEGDRTAAWRVNLLLHARHRQRERQQRLTAPDIPRGVALRADSLRHEGRHVLQHRRLNERDAEPWPLCQHHRAAVLLLDAHLHVIARAEGLAGVKQREERSPIELCDPTLGHLAQPRLDLLEGPRRRARQQRAQRRCTEAPLAHDAQLAAVLHLDVGEASNACARRSRLEDAQGGHVAAFHKCWRPANLRLEAALWELRSTVLCTSVHVLNA
mmetsp:Transcript_41876/g.87642  ORF Transcript_41876/g.87642 Transcript_41876/m.87642 type:complete len:233 (-) Transcript_41876:233-931(-)